MHSGMLLCAEWCRKCYTVLLFCAEWCRQCYTWCTDDAQSSAGCATRCAVPTRRVVPAVLEHAVPTRRVVPAVLEQQRDDAQSSAGCSTAVLETTRRGGACCVYTARTHLGSARPCCVCLLSTLPGCTILLHVTAPPTSGSAARAEHQREEHRALACSGAWVTPLRRVGAGFPVRESDDARRVCRSLAACSCQRSGVVRSSRAYRRDDTVVHDGTPCCPFPSMNMQTVLRPSTDGTECSTP